MTRQETFDVGGAVRIDVETRSGAVDVRAVAGDRVVVTIDGSSAEGWEVTHLGGSVSIRPGWGWRSRSARIIVDAPSGSDVDVRGASTDVTLLGALGAVRIRTVSGDVRADTVTSFDSNTASGDVRIHAVTGRATVATVSGDIELVDVGGDAVMSSASGTMAVHRIGGDVQVSSTSGDVRIGRFDGDDLSVKSVSGDVQLKLPGGIRVEPDISTLSGRTRLPTPAAPTGVVGERRRVRVRIKTVSGNITLDRA